MLPPEASLAKERCFAAERHRQAPLTADCPVDRYIVRETAAHAGGGEIKDLTEVIVILLPDAQRCCNLTRHHRAAETEG
jgi:hypothetical protein